MSARRLFGPGELAGASCALALLISMFALAWFGVDPTPGRARPGAAALDAWNALTLLRWLLLLVAAVALAAPPLHVSQRRHGGRTDLAAPLALLSTAVLVLLALRVLVLLPAPQRIVDQKLGALVGLGCLLGLTLAAWRGVTAGRAAPAAAQHRPRPSAPPGPVPSPPASPGPEPRAAP